MALPPIPIVAATAAPPLLLVVGLAATAAAAWAGGVSVTLLRLGHRRMQVLLSFTGGILLGVAFLHLLPHAAAASGGVDEAAGWALGGFFLMFLLERAFHGHAHHAADPEHGPAGGCDHGDHAHGHHHDGPRHDAPRILPRPEGAGKLAWMGTFAGLAVHSLADGAALAAATDAAAGNAGVLAGLATLVAILLHKPIDAGLIAALLIQSGASPRTRSRVNLVHALLVPIGALAFLFCLQGAGDVRAWLLGPALGLAAGAFVCIAAADLLPEVEFHSHDRLLLSASLALGITAAMAVTGLERGIAARARAFEGKVESFSPQGGTGPDSPPAADAARSSAAVGGT